MNILITGVGGQGTILASKILAAAALYDGKNAMTGETIGMSQRGGCVCSHVRIGDIHAPYIPKGAGDLLLALELCEGARCLPYLRPGAAAVVSLTQIRPVAAALRGEPYNAGAMQKQIAERCVLLPLDAEKTAKSCGSAKAANIVLLGAAFGAGLLPLSRPALMQAIGENVPEKYAALNLEAFTKGEGAAKSMCDCEVSCHEC